MKTLLKVIVTSGLFLLLIVTNSARGQVIAGAIPAGGYIVDPGFNFSVVIVDDDTSGTLDLNCDNIPDMAVSLFRGLTAVDQANVVSLHVLNSAYSICAGPNSGLGKVVNYYDSGTVVDCSGSFSWQVDSLFILGNYGCLVCNGPWTINDKYFAYNDGTNIGWIKVSFDVMDAGGSLPITLRMNQYLTYCLPNSVDENSIENDFQISPNPTVDGKVNLLYKGSIAEIEVYNSIGQKVDYLLSGNELFLPETKGVYVVKIRKSNGRQLSKSVVRN